MKPARLFQSVQEDFPVYITLTFLFTIIQMDYKYTTDFKNCLVFSNQYKATRLAVYILN